MGTPRPAEATFSPALPDDVAVIEALAHELRLDTEHLEAAQFVVIRGSGATPLLGFGRIKPYDGRCFELGTVGVVAAARGRGLGEALVRHLMTHFPTPEVWITTDLHDWFRRFGFRPAEELGVPVPAPLVDKLARVCGTIRQNVIAMVAPRP